VSDTVIDNSEEIDYYKKLDAAVLQLQKIYARKMSMYVKHADLEKDRNDAVYNLLDVVDNRPASLGGDDE
jgi:hypothetical protein